MNLGKLLAPFLHICSLPRPSLLEPGCAC
jgi:hypothetical protein